MISYWRAALRVGPLCITVSSALAPGPISNETKYWIVAIMWEAAVGEDPAAAIYKGQAESLAEANWMLNATNEQLAKLQTLLTASPWTQS